MGSLLVFTSSLTRSDTGRAKADIPIGESAAQLLDRVGQLSVKTTCCFEPQDSRTNPL